RGVFTDDATARPGVPRRYPGDAQGEPDRPPRRRDGPAAAGSGISSAVRDRLRPPARRAHRRRVPRPGETPPGGRRMIGLTHYLALGALLFVCGAVCMAVKRNAIGVLMGVELVLNGANVNYVAFARYNPTFALEGQVFALF